MTAIAAALGAIRAPALGLGRVLRDLVAARYPAGRLSNDDAQDRALWVALVCGGHL